MKAFDTTFMSPAMSLHAYEEDPGSAATNDDLSGPEIMGDYPQHSNHTLYGSLRRGGAVSFFSWKCAGLCAATFSSVFSYLALQGVTQPLINKQLGLTPSQTLAVRRFIELPMALSFLIGLLSDCYPIMGLRRKAYMIVGLVLNAVATLTIALIAVYFESTPTENRSSGLVWLVILLTALASFGCMFTYLCIHTRTIELSQQEPLGIRGSIQASYLIVRRLTSLFTGVFVYIVVGDSSSKPNISLSTSLFLMVALCVLPVPVILKFWHEEHYSLPVSFQVRSQIFWKILQQKAVWRTVTFVAFFGLFLAINFTDSNTVIRRWAGAAKDNTLVVRMISDVTQLFVLLVWRYVFMNRPWRTFFAMAPVFKILPAVLISALVAFDVNRDRYLYRGVFSLTLVSGGISVLNNIVPVTEIVQEGSEGVTVGLVLTLQRLISTFVGTNAQGLFRSDNFYDLNDVKLDNSHIQMAVFLSLVVNYLVNSVSGLGLLFLPSQKLDAQQMRMYGGFTKVAATGMVAFALVLFFYSVTVNLMTFIPATACARLVGGKGC